MQAAGLLIFRKFEGSIQYLLLETSYGKNHWTPPKGFLDGQEKPLDAALRETEEEAGLTENDFELWRDSEYICSYYDPTKKAQKSVHYWLARLRSPHTNIRLSHEHKDFKWVGLEEACKLTGWDNFREFLRSSEAAIQEQDTTTC